MSRSREGDGPFGSVACGRNRRIARRREPAESRLQPGLAAPQSTRASRECERCTQECFHLVADQTLEGRRAWTQSAPRAELQQPGGFPHAALRGSLQIEQTDMGRIVFVQAFEQVRDAAQNHRQFIIQVSGRGAGHGIGAICSHNSFHVSIVTGVPKRAAGSKQRSLCE
jgi:hypothetical protein